MVYVYICITSLEFFDNSVKIIKKDAELISPGTLYSKDLNCLRPSISITS